MPTAVLTDVARDLWVESFALHSADLGAAGAPWSVTKRTLRGGRRDGVDLVEVTNGALAFSIIPTRGMGIWKGSYLGDRLGWDSPTQDGPIHPAFVDLGADGGIGWLDGFDELLARCGLSHNGAPFVEGNAVRPLHGRIANLPAHYVAVHVDDKAPHAITIEGHVPETRIFGKNLRLSTRITTVPGSSALTVRDEVINLGDTPAEFQLLYHWNFGPPYLEAGSRFVAPTKVVAARDPRAVEGVDTYATYGPPEPGFAEQAYFFELLGSGADGRTLALLRNRAGDKAVALRYATSQLPCFALWKNTAGLKDGYVTGLEPATNFPNPLPFERERGRVVRLAPGASHVAETTLEAFAGTKAVAAAEAEVAALQGQVKAEVRRVPGEPYSAGA